jgi:lipopolysaccharide biosynthesis glycosyltransferase
MERSVADEDPVEISLLSAINQDYRIPFEVLATSLLFNKQPATVVEWHVFTAEQGDWRAWLDALGAKYREQHVTFALHHPRWQGSENLPTRGRTRPIVYTRLLAPEQAPLATAKALFLDADMIVVRPIEELWCADLSSRPCACCQDLAVPTVSSGMAIGDPAWWDDDRHQPYFNAGLMLIDVNAWKEQEVKGRALAYLAKRGDAVNLFEQEALNAALGRNWQRLSCRWNLIASLADRPFLDTTWLDRDDYAASLREPGIIHFAGTLKPWRNPYLKGRWHDLYRIALGRALPAHRFRFAVRDLFHAGYDAWLRRWTYPLEQAVWRARRGF